MESKKPEPVAEEKLPPSENQAVEANSVEQPAINDNAGKARLWNKILADVKSRFLRFKIPDLTAAKKNVVDMRSRIEKVLQWRPRKNPEGGSPGNETAEPQPDGTKIRRFKGRRAAILSFETLAVIAVLIVLATGVAAWRLKSGPVDIGFAKDYIENALYSPERGIRLTSWCRKRLG